MASSYNLVFGGSLQILCLHTMEVAKDFRKNAFEASQTDIVVDSTVTNNHEIPTSFEEPVDPVMYSYS